MRINKAEITHNRWSFSGESSSWTFYDLVQNPVWIGVSSKRTYIVSRDGGKTINDEEIQELWGSFYFISEEVRIHNKTKYSINDLLGDMGGLFEVFHMILLAVLSPINDMKFFNKAIRAVYYKEQRLTKDAPMSFLKPVKFNIKH